MTRKRLGQGRYGPHGQSVNLSIEGDRIVALWRVHSRRHKKTWPNTATHRAEAKAWAEAFAETRQHARAPVERLTTRTLWQRYAAAEFPTLRPRSQAIYREYWTPWEVFVAPESLADDLGLDTMAAFRGDLEGRTRKLAPATIGKILSTVKLVYSWGYRHRLLTRNDVREYRYKVAKEQRLTPPGEYRGDELVALLAQLPLEQAGTWRAHAVLTLCGLQGARQNAVLHLRWEDVDLTAGTVTWRARFDKVGREWVQPLRAGSVVVLRAIEVHGATGWVFPAASAKSQRETYSAQSLWAALRRAERAAGIAHQARRGAHGLRRMLFNDVLGVTGDIGAAMAAIHDTDLRVASRYLVGRDDRVRQAFAALDAPNSPTNSPKMDDVLLNGVD